MYTLVTLSPPELHAVCLSAEFEVESSLTPDCGLLGDNPTLSAQLQSSQANREQELFLSKRSLVIWFANVPESDL